MRESESTNETIFCMYTFSLENDEAKTHTHSHSFCYAHMFHYFFPEIHNNDFNGFAIIIDFLKWSLLNHFIFVII